MTELTTPELLEITGRTLAVSLSALVTALALGVIMHTTSRRLFHGQKDLWMFGMLVSDSVQQRFSEIGVVRSSPGGPTYAEILKVETENRVRRAGAFLHGMEYQVMIRAPEVYRMLQVYRDQYRVARGLIIPSAVLALILPFWDPVMALEVGTFGPFPIIRSQMFMLSVLASAVSYVAFRERAFRYAAAQTLAFVTLEGLRSEDEGSA